MPIIRLGKITETPAARAAISSTKPTPRVLRPKPRCGIASWIIKSATSCDTREPARSDRLACAAGTGRRRWRARFDALSRIDEITADRVIHVLGLFAGALGSAALISVARRQPDGGGELGPITVYSACLMAMLCCSAAYNLCRSDTPRNASACRPRGNLP